MSNEQLRRWDELSDETRLTVVRWLVTPRGDEGYGRMPALRDTDQAEVLEALACKLLESIDREAVATRILPEIEVMLFELSGLALGNNLDRLTWAAKAIGAGSLDELRQLAKGDREAPLDWSVATQVTVDPGGTVAVEVAGLTADEDGWRCACGRRPVLRFAADDPVKLSDLRQTVTGRPFGAKHVSPSYEPESDESLSARLAQALDQLIRQCDIDEAEDLAWLGEWRHALPKEPT